MPSWLLPVAENANIKQQSHDFVCSWSGGKDACLALFLMQQHGHNAKALLTMMRENGQQSRAHHLPAEIIQQQANALNLPCILQAAAKSDYQNAYLEALAQSQTLGADSVILGDIDLQAHRDWQERQAKLSHLSALFPLWLTNHRELVDSFIELGFKAMIMAVHPEKCPESFLGKMFDMNTIAELEQLGIDVCAEGGEFHTVVTDGPIFKQPIELNLVQATIQDGEFGYRYLDFSQ